METFVPFDHLPTETRMMALCLPIPDKNLGGRPRQLSLYEAVAAVERVQTLINAEALLAIREDDSIFVRLRRKLRNLRARQAAPHRIVRVQDEMDAVGRFSSIPVKRPSPGTVGRIERKVAKEIGISPRQLRRYGADKDIRALVSKPIWEPTELEREGRGLFLIRKTIDALLSRMTPERRAKEERIGVLEGVARTLDHPEDVGYVQSTWLKHDVGYNTSTGIGHRTTPFKRGDQWITIRAKLRPPVNYEHRVLKWKYSLEVRFWPK